MWMHPSTMDDELRVLPGNEGTSWTELSEVRMKGMRERERDWQMGSQVQHCMETIDWLYSIDISCQCTTTIGTRSILWIRTIGWEWLYIVFNTLSHTHHIRQTTRSRSVILERNKHIVGQLARGKGGIGDDIRCAIRGCRRDIQCSQHWIPQSTTSNAGIH